MKHMENIKQLKEYLKSYKDLKNSVQSIRLLLSYLHCEWNEDQTQTSFSSIPLDTIPDSLMDTLYLLTEKNGTGV